MAHRGTTRHSSRDHGSRVPSKIVDKNTGKAYRTGNMLGKVTHSAAQQHAAAASACGWLTWLCMAAGWLRDSVPVHLPEDRQREGRQGRRALQHPRLQVEAEGERGALGRYALRPLRYRHSRLTSPVGARRSNCTLRFRSTKP